MCKTLKPALESIEFVFGTIGRGYRLLTYSDGLAIIASHSWRTWGDVAATTGQTWYEFAMEHAGEFQAWCDHHNRAVHARTPVDQADRGTILDLFLGSPEAASAQELLDQIGSSGRAFERLSQLATMSNGVAGMASGADMTDVAIAGFQRVLDEEGLGHIRLVRDDEFIRAVYSPSDSEPARQHGLPAQPALLH